VLNAYVDALTRADPDALVSLLRADVEMEMPPIPTWITGQRAVLGFLATRVLRVKGQWRMVPTRANSQPALVINERAGEGRYGEPPRFRIPDPIRSGPGTEDDLCENGVESSRLSSKTRP
jgi:hypothetical protein